MLSFRHEAIWILWNSEGWTHHMLSQAFRLSEKTVKQLIDEARNHVKED